MVQRVDDIRDVFAQVTVDVIGLFQKLRRLIHQVGGQNVVEKAAFIRLVEFFKSAGEETEGSTDENFSS